MATPGTAGSSPPVSSGSSSATASGSSGGTAIILPPCYPGYSDNEYGYVVQQVSGPTTVSVTTQPLANIPTTTVTVHVHYVNGSAAVGTNVYASVLGGQWYPYAYGVNSASIPAGTFSMSGVVGSDGTAKLTVPSVPVDVTAWNWVPVNLPAGPSSVQVNVGGEKVNVTVYWQPSYVGLAGSVLIVPPQISGSIVLHVEQPEFWATPAGAQTVNSAATGSTSTPATVASGPNLVPASLTTQQSTGQSSVQTVTSTATILEQTQAKTASTTGGSGSPNYDIVLLTVVGALALGIASASLIVVRRRPDSVR